MHYHPFRDMLWLPLILSVLSGLFGIPITVATAALTGLLPNLFGAPAGG